MGVPRPGLPPPVGGADAPAACKGVRPCEVPAPPPLSAPGPSSQQPWLSRLPITVRGTGLGAGTRPSLGAALTVPFPRSPGISPASGVPSAAKAWSPPPWLTRTARSTAKVGASLPVGARRLGWGLSRGALERVVGALGGSSRASRRPFVSHGRPAPGETVTWPESQGKWGRGVRASS